MKKLIVLLFLISTVSLSQTRDIVPRADREGYIGTMGKHWLGANLDSLNGIAIGTYISQKDSATKYLPFWWNGKYYLKSDTNSATLGFYPRQQIDALIASLSGGGIASLNGLTGASQTFAIDTTVSGVPAFSSAMTVHTLQLPFARFLRQSDTTASVAMQWELDGKLGLGLARLTGDSSAIAGTAGKYISPTMVAASYAPIASPTFTGTVTLPTGLTGTVRVASGVVSATASDTIGLGVNLYGKVNVSDTSATPSGRGKVVTPSMLALKAPLASPTFTGTVTLPVGLTGTVRVASGVVSSTASDSIGLGVNLYGKVNVADSSATPGTAGKYITPTMVATTYATKASLNAQIISFTLDSSWINVTDTIWTDLPENTLTVDSISVSPVSVAGGTAVSIVPKFLYRTAPYQTCTAIITSPATITSAIAKTWQSTINNVTLPANGQVGVLHTTVTTKPKQECIGIKVNR